MSNLRSKGTQSEQFLQNTVFYGILLDLQSLEMSMVKHLKPRIWRTESSRCLMLDSPSLNLELGVLQHEFLSKKDFTPN